MTKEQEANSPSPDVVRIDTQESDRKPASCCLCLNVRIGTILIGLFNLVSYLKQICFCNNVNNLKDLTLSLQLL